MRKGAAARVLVIVLLLQAAAYYAVASRREIVPDARPLATFPAAVDGWTVAREFPLEKEVADVLRADDTLNRIYLNGEHGLGIGLFIAYFRTQQYGQSPHSPKNCLPGAGWTPVRDRKIHIPVAGRAEPLEANEYIIERGNERSLVLYWYESHGRAIASEFAAKFWLVVDAVRLRRSDTALVRITVPVPESGAEQAEAAALVFTKTMYPRIAAQLGE